MKRLIAVLLLIFVVFGVVAIPVTAQEAPQGTWLGTWPYVLPPDHHLNGYASGGLDDNLGSVYRGMVELTPAFYTWADNTYSPNLAESWGFTEDNSAYWIKLRADAKWSNGDAVNADDVIDTYALGRLIGWTQFSYISTVEKLDDQTVQFTFSGEPSLLAERLLLKEYIRARATYGELAQEALTLFESGKDKDSDEWKALATKLSEFRPSELIASGPYTYALSDVGDAFMTLHWQPNSIYSSSVKFGSLKLWAGETEVTTPLVLSGELAQSTNVYPPSTIETFKAQGIRLVTMPRGYGPALLFNHTVAPWNVKEVRQATALVINREQSAFLTNGIGATPTVYMAGLLDDNVPLLLSQDVIDKLDHYDFNPDRASQLLESVGFSKNADGKWADKDGNLIHAEYTFPAEFADFSGAAQDAISQMNAFGYDIVARSLPWQEAAAAIRAGDFQLSVWSWASGSPFASTQFNGPTRRFNYVALADGQRGMDFPMEFEYNGEQVDLNDLILNASAGLDLAAQMERAGKVAMILNDLMPFIPLNIELSVEPFNEDAILGVPADDDPILKNPTGSDHFLISYLLTGKLSPGPTAME